ncbi:unnamed protein product [Sphenostylis stenocarpa]|uniref:Kinesin motor domain-containing protein n=1 Tax=Sphenostylis stenocarpa TaxID=92480 RepID=A0AA86RWW9_9FABA|nr:unnamed protein product [Sphenostylis stenocarpa]
MVEAGEDCCVKVAVHVRPLIGEEKVRGCKDCVSVVPGKPRVHLLNAIIGESSQWRSGSRIALRINVERVCQFGIAYRIRLICLLR